MEVIGQIEAISVKENRYAILIGENWFSAFGKIPEIEKGDRVKIEYETTTTKSGTFNNIKKIEKIEAVKEIQQTVSKIQSTVSEEPKAEEKQKTQQTSQIDERLRSMAVSYAKDLVVAGKIEFSKMYEVAEEIIKFIKELK